MNIHLVLTTLPSSPASLLLTSNPSVFPNYYILVFNFPFLITRTSSYDPKSIYFLLLLPKHVHYVPSSLSQACFWITRQSDECTNRLYLNHLHKTEPLECCTYFWASHARGQFISLCLVFWNSKFNRIRFKKTQFLPQINKTLSPRMRTNR